MGEQILALFGVNPADLAMVAGAVYIAVEYIKGELSSGWGKLPKWARKIIPFLIAGLISYKINAANGGTDWWQIVSLALAATVAPAGVHNQLKKMRRKP